MSRPSVFICYSSEDKRWKKVVLEYLGVLKEEGELDLWHDGRIGVGEEWRKEIETSLNNATVAVFLVSPSSLNSRFIRDTELPRIFERRDQEVLLLIPLVLRPSGIKAIPWLQKLELRPKGKALSEMTKPQRERLLSDLIVELRERLQSADPPPRTPGKTLPSSQVQVTLNHLPPGTEHFVGREKELQALDDAWAAGETVNALSRRRSSPVAGPWSWRRRAGISSCAWSAV